MIVIHPFNHVVLIHYTKIIIKIEVIILVFCVTQNVLIFYFVTLIFVIGSDLTLLYTKTCTIK